MVLLVLLFTHTQTTNDDTVAHCITTCATSTQRMGLYLPMTYDLGSQRLKFMGTALGSLNYIL